MKIRKPSKYVRHYGFELEYEKSLSDQEVRLFHLYKLMVDWDSKHAETFGFCTLTVRQIREALLPNWSTGKISTVRQSLIRKDWLEKHDGMIGVKNYRAYRIKKVQDAELYVQRAKSGIHENEHVVQLSEQASSPKPFNYPQERDELIEKMRFGRSDS